jgi:hypothetical protein
MYDSDQKMERDRLAGEDGPGSEVDPQVIIDFPFHSVRLYPNPAPVKEALC